MTYSAVMRGGVLTLVAPRNAEAHRRVMRLRRRLTAACWAAVCGLACAVIAWRVMDLAGGL